MKPIYKSLALAAMTLQVSLTLNAETRDDKNANTIALQAELLDGLRVELVSLNVSGARDLIKSGECVIEGSNLTITLDASEWTRGAMYRVQVLATFGTQTQVIYAVNITVPYYVALSDGLQEFEDDVTIVSTITDVTEADLEGLALEETSQEIKTIVNGHAQDLIALAQSYGQLASDVQAIKDAHILSFNYDGIVFVQGFEPKSAFGVIANRAEIVEIHDNKDTTLPGMAASDYPNLEVFEMNEAENMHDMWMYGSNTLKEVVLPQIQYTNLRAFRDMLNLRKTDLRHVKITMTDNYFHSFGGSPRLIDLIYGSSETGNINALKYWNPTVALESDNLSLLTDADIEAGFTSNREKLLWNIRNHIAADLNPEVTATITFSAAVYAAIIADQDTVDAFPASWTIASA